MKADEYREHTLLEEEFFRQARSGVWLDISDHILNKMWETVGIDPMVERLCKITSDGKNVSILQLHFVEGDPYPEYAHEMIVPMEAVTVAEGDPPVILVETEYEAKMTGTFLDYIVSDDMDEKRLEKAVNRAMQEFIWRQPTVFEAELRARIHMDEDDE